MGEREFELSREAVESFLVPKGEGAVLGDELARLYPSDPGVLEWMPYWQKWYLSHRAALPVNCNPFYLLSPKAEDLEIDQAGLAARGVSAILAFYREVKESGLPQDLWKGTPLSMSQYRDIVGITRIPGKDMDENVRSDTDWIAVICRGRLFRQKVLDRKGIPFPGEGLAKSFAAILDICRQGEPEPFPLAALTCLPRPRWAQLRKNLCSASCGVTRAVDVMEGSLFVVCLDPPQALDEEGLSQGLLHGVPGNRWFDKSIQLVVLGEGRMGINFEHSARDGTPMGRFVRLLCEKTEQCDLVPGSAPSPEEVTPQPDDALQAAVEEARNSAEKIFSRTHLSLLRFEDFGKGRIKALGVSPDGFLQTALFLAQDRAWGRCRSVFESVMLRTFRAGRTEGMRPFNRETGKFIEAMKDGSVNRKERAGLLRRALEFHGDRIALCMRGHGVEGHLGLLMAISRGQVGDCPLQSIPGLFRCPAWKVLQDIGITTSTTSGEGIEAAGYGPALEDGLAVRYLQRSDHLLLSVTGFDPGEAGRRGFLNHLPDALIDMERLLC